MRGCKLALVPTTVLAQVDATLGGKTGINFGGHKNMVGSFYPAHEIRIVPETLASLPENEYRGGLAEVLKHAFLVGGALLDLVETRREAILARDPAILPGLIWDSLMVKARVVEEDLREQGVRAHLNLGHTFGHGLEAAAGFGVWNHGDAVAWGMVKAARLARRLGACDAAWADRVAGLLAAYGFADQAPGVPVDRIIEAMLLDKKKKGGQVRFILQRGPADTYMAPVDEADLRAVLSD
jgi:3-dehydroquinate synthase